MLRRIAVGDETAIEIGGAAGDIGNGLGDTAAGAGFRAGDPAAPEPSVFPHQHAEPAQLVSLITSPREFRYMRPIVAFIKRDATADAWKCVAPRRRCGFKRRGQAASIKEAPQRAAAHQHKEHHGGGTLRRRPQGAPEEIRMIA